MQFTGTLTDDTFLVRGNDNRSKTGRVETDVAG